MGGTPVAPTFSVEDSAPPTPQFTVEDGASAHIHASPPPQPDSPGYGKAGISKFQKGLSWLENASGNFTESFGLPRDITQWPAAFAELTKNPVPFDPTGGALTIGKNMVAGVLSAHAKAANEALKDAQGAPNLAQKIGHYGQYFESGIPAFGPNLVQAGKQFESGDISGGVGRTAGVAAQIFGPELSKAAGTAMGKTQAVLGKSARQSIVDGSVARIDSDVNGLQEDLVNAQTNVMDRVGEHVQRIVDADAEQSAADAQARGSVPRGTIDIAKAQSEMTKAADQFRPSTAQPSAINKVAEQLGSVPPKITWEQAKDIRTNIGAALAKASGRDRGILSAIYGNLTDQMRDRATDLGLGEQFEAYNTLTEKMYGWEDKIFGKLLSSKNGMNIAEEIYKPSNSAQLADLQSDLEQFGLPENYFKDFRDSHRATYAFARAAEATGGKSGMIGKLRAIEAHPVVGTLTAAALYEALPGPGKFLFTLLGVAKAADIADRVNVLRELSKLGGVPPTTGTFGTAGMVKP